MRRTPHALRGGLAALCLLWAGAALALGVTYTTPLEAAFNALLSTKMVAESLGKIGTQAPLTFEERKRLAAMPAAGRHASRARYMLAALQHQGLENAHVDGAGNVVAERLGLLHQPRLVVAARLDGPDEGRGLVVLLTMLGTLQSRSMQTVGDVVFIGLDDAAGAPGVQTALREAGQVDGFILVDGSARNSSDASAPGAATTEPVLVDAARRAVQLMTAPAAQLPAPGSAAAHAQAAGIPAVVLSDGGASGAAAVAGASYRPADEWKGPQALLLTTLAAAGMAGVCDPLLAPVKAPALR